MSRGSNFINNSKKCHTLWVGDLEPEVDEKYLRSVFGQNQNVKSIHIYKDKITNGRVNYAFLEFETADIAERVLHLFNGKEKPRFGKPFKINWGNQKSKRERPQNMFGMNPPYMGGRFPMPGGFNGRMPPGMMPPGMVPNMRGMYPGMFPPMRGNMRNPPPMKRGEPDNVSSIYVGDLNDFCEQTNLFEFFKEKFKSVVGAKVIKDHVTRKNKGFGFVQFEDPQEAERAISEMNGAMFMGRRIKTGRSFSKNSSSNPQNYRNPMFNMMGGRQMPMGMPMGMGRPMMPPGGFPPQGFPPHMVPHDQNRERNRMPEPREPPRGETKPASGGPARRDLKMQAHYRKTRKPESPKKEPSYMISTTQEMNQKPEKRDKSEESKSFEKEKKKEKVSKIEVKILESDEKEKGKGKEKAAEKEDLNDTKDKSERAASVEKGEAPKEEPAPKKEPRKHEPLLKKRAEMDKDEDNI